MGSWYPQESRQTTLDLLLDVYNIHILCMFILYLYKCYYSKFQSHTHVFHVSVTNCLYYPQVSVKVLTPEKCLKVTWLKVFTNIEGLAMNHSRVEDA